MPCPTLARSVRVDDHVYDGVADVLDEARHGLDWLRRMYGDGALYNQVGDDRDHQFLDLPPTDSSDYGWGKGARVRSIPAPAGRRGSSPTRTARHYEWR